MEAYIRIEPDADSGLEVETCKRGERDLVVELSVCRAHGRSLVGPPPLELIGEVPDERVTAVGAAVLADWQRLDYDPDLGAFMVFTTCRIWRFAEEHVHCTKQEAADWVLARDRSVRAVDAALHDRPLEESDVRQLMARVQAAIT